MKAWCVEMLGTWTTSCFQFSEDGNKHFHRTELAWVIIIETMVEFGLELNLKPGKSETIIFWAGKKASQLELDFQENVGCMLSLSTSVTMPGWAVSCVSSSGVGFALPSSSR